MTKVWRLPGEAYPFQVYKVYKVFHVTDLSY